MNLKIFIFFVLLGFFLFSPGAMAEENSERTGFWGGIDVGAGYVQRSFGDNEEDEYNFFLGFEVGYTITANLLVGLELSGWTLESSNLEDPSKGEGISQVFLITRYYPSISKGFFAKVGGGYLSYWNNRPGEARRKNGWGLTFGGGYDFSIHKNFALTPFLNYSFGEADNQKHHAITIGVGLTIQDF
jgi:hypothetical protein